ncbi:hypothetical protein PIB30_084886 [Stylosanthes scabra]|uniref:Uncharacterized protein n=1 Tax=Stylosanthes scabra TaxID=79078 RepID=A0ABU6QTI1_9FABA|nr:hypothetical protein [Stylosanthes scabra]
MTIVHHPLLPDLSSRADYVEIRHCLILPRFRLYQRDILLCRSEDTLLGFQELATSSIATAAAPRSFAANVSHFYVMLSRRRPVSILHH